MELWVPVLRPGTQGWSDLVDAYQFTSARSAATVVAGAEASMKIAVGISGPPELSTRADRTDMIQW